MNPPKPSALRVGLLTFLIASAVLAGNGRAIGSGDTRAVEETARSLAQSHSFVLPPGEPADPFTRAIPEGRVSIYPPLTALLSAPLFFAFGLFFDLDLSGTQIAGKLTAVILAALATAILACSFARRTSAARAVVAALLFGLGTSVYSTAQALWQHGATVLFLLVAIDAMDRLGDAHLDERRLSMRAGLALSLAAASRSAAIPMCATLFLFLLNRARRHSFLTLAAGALPAAFVGAYNTTFFGAPWRFGNGLSGRFFSALPDSLPGLLISPGRGLFVFTPLALLALAGLLRAARTQSLARGLLSAVVIHVVFISTWNEWHGGESFGPRLLTDMLPALCFFLPETLMAMPALGTFLGVISVGIQLLGGWTYDYRWERLHQRGQDFDAALWQWTDLPVGFALREGVVTQGIPGADGRALRLRPYRFAPFGPKGSSIEPAETTLGVSGAALVRDVRLERGGRVRDGVILLSHPLDALAFRSLSGSGLSVRVVGQINGLIAVETPQGSTRIPASGAFDLTLPLPLAKGADVFVRAEVGELRLRKLEVAATPATSARPPI